MKVMIIGANASVFDVVTAAHECLKRKVEILILDNHEEVIQKIIKEVPIEGGVVSFSFSYSPEMKRKKSKSKKNIHQTRGWRNPYSK